MRIFNLTTQKEINYGKIICTRNFQIIWRNQEAGQKWSVPTETTYWQCFHKPIEGCEINDTLTELTKTLYKHEESRWYEITGNMCDGGVVQIGIKYNERVFIPLIIDDIDVGEGEYRFFIIVNESRTEYQWVTAILLATGYMDVNWKGTKITHPK